MNFCGSVWLTGNLLFSTNNYGKKKINLYVTWINWNKNDKYSSDKILLIGNLYLKITLRTWNGFHINEMKEANTNIRLNNNRTLIQ